MTDKELKELHTLALQEFEASADMDKEQRELAIEDNLFANVPGTQWDENVAQAFDDNGRPRFEINLVAAVINSMVGEQRANEVMVKFRPKGGGATKDKAETLDGVYRNIVDQSEGKRAHDTAYEEHITGGYGAWRIETYIPDDSTFDLDIAIREINDAASSLYFSADAKKANKTDAMMCWYKHSFNSSIFKAKWPNENPADFSDPLWNKSYCKSWRTEDTISVAEFWRKVPITRNLGLLSDGRVIDLDEESDVLDELAAEGITVVKEAKRKSYRVEQFLMTGEKFIEGPNPWAGTLFPFIPIFAHRNRIGGKEFVRGIVRAAKDPIRINNYTTSATVEVVAVSPKDPYWITTEQAKGHTDSLSNMGVSNKAVQLYNHASGHPPPYRTGAPSPQVALIGIGQTAKEDVRLTLGAVAGSQSPDVGTSIDRRSGEAVRAQAIKGNVSTARYTDSWLEGIKTEGKILMDLIPRVYDTERQIRILNPDGTEEFITLNQTVIDQQTGNKVIVNDLSMGKYDMSVDVGPAFATDRQEKAQQLMDLMKASPEIAALANDLIAKGLGHKELHERLRKQGIRAGIITPTDEEIQEMGLANQEPTRAEILADAREVATIKVLEGEAAKSMADARWTLMRAEEAAAKAENIDFDSLKKATEAEGANLDNIKKTAELGLPFSVQDHDKRISMKDMVEQAEQNIQPGPTSEQIERATGQS